MASNEPNATMLGRPAVVAHEVPYEPPPPPTNPVVRGLPLYYGAQLISNVTVIQNFLWSNAGFNKLRGRPELEHVSAISTDIEAVSVGDVIRETLGTFLVEPTYIPSVIRLRDPRTTNTLDFSNLNGRIETWKPLKSTAFKSTLDYHLAYRQAHLTPTAVAEAILPLIRHDVQTPSKHSTAFLQTNVDAVLKAAKASTKRYETNSSLSPLDGVPVAIKDEMDLQGYAKRLGSLIDFTDKHDRTSYCCRKLLDAGAVIIGKNNMHEFGLDTTNNNPNYGTPLNPYNNRYYCGGSSGGSAYTVAAGLAPIAVGADGGGSIRIPSAYCGLYGLKPSHGRISGRPTTSLAASTGVLGPIAANMVDLEIAYRVMAQPDELDNVSSLFASPGSSSAQSNRRKVLGIYRTWFDRADEEVQKVCWKAIDHLTSDLGYELVDITIPMIHDGQMAHAMTILSEISTTMRSVKDLTAANKILISVGSKTPAVDFLQAQKVRSLLMQHLAYLYEQNPGMIIVTPTTPNAGWHINPGDLKYGCSNGNMSIRNMEYAWLANFGGCPAISVPVGYVDPLEGEGKIPIGLMGMNEWCGEDELIAFGYEAESYLHDRCEGGRLRPEGWVDVCDGLWSST